MPIFEFVCADCGHPFEELLRSASSISEVKCPKCGSDDIRKKLSAFATRSAGSASFSSSASSCGPVGT